MHRTLASLLVLAALSAGGAAFAEDSTKPSAGRGAAAATPKSVDRADELFEQAANEYDAGRFAQAQAKLDQAWALKKTHDIAGNLGVVEVKLGMFARAAEHLSWALRHFPPTEADQARQGFEQQLAKARAQCGALRVRVNVEGAELTVNGRAVGSSPLADEVFVDAGTVNLKAQRDGYGAVQQSIAVPKGERRELTLTLTPTEKTERRSIVPGAVLGAVGGAAVLAGIGLLAGSSSKASSASGVHDDIAKAGHDCTPGASTYDARCDGLASTSKDANLFRDAGIGLMIGGGVVAAGAVTYFLWPQSSASKGTALSMRVVPVASATGGGMFALGVF
jgi:hypothetical protein